MEFSQLLEKLKEYNMPPDKIPILEEAYKFASEKHKGQMRLTGEAFLEHPLQTAYILAELHFDTTTLAAAMLHDIPEDTGVPLADIETKFGSEIAQLVDGVTKLGKVSISASGALENANQAENLSKMLVAMAKDLRVVFIKLADRLHNMRTLHGLPKERQLKNARETLEIYAPLAHRLGIWELKWQLEDLSFRYLEPLEYKRVADLVEIKRAEREELVVQAIKILKKEFERVGLVADITGRPKHIYGIYQKEQRYATIGKDFYDIYDLLAIRVIVGTLQECYSAVGVIHSLWHPIPEAFDDYIASPKPNGYQSIHTAVVMGSKHLEIQIRTREMHYVAEFGAAVHWGYKGGNTRDARFEDRVGWLRQLIEWRRELSGAEEFLESVKTDILIDQVYVYTPKNEIKELPSGATPLDFAYRVHTDLGHRCIGAKINGKLVPLSYELKNGDVIEILTSKAPRGPSLDWLNPSLGFVHTSHAKGKIRQWFNKREKAESIERGKQILDKELRRLGIQTDRQAIAALFSFNNLEDFIAAVGNGSITAHQIVLKLAAQEEKTEQAAEVVVQPKITPSAVQVLGVGDLMTSLAQCCQPVPGDKIIGYITRSRGVTIHRQDCYNVINEDEKERLVPVEWGQSDLLYPVKIQLDAWDRVGLMRDISTLVAEEKVNISSMNLAGSAGPRVTIYLTLQTKGLAHLSQILKKIDGVKGVINVSRVGNEQPRQNPADSSAPAKKVEDIGLSKN